MPIDTRIINLCRSFQKELSDDVRFTTVTQDALFAQEMQMKRLKAYNLTMDNELDFLNNQLGVTLRSEDDHYIYDSLRTEATMKKTFKVGGQLAYQAVEHCNMYLSTIDYKNPNAIEADEYICPNCGGVSTVNEFMHGCKKCGAKFSVDELFPKVTLFGWSRGMWASFASMIEANCKARYETDMARFTNDYSYEYLAQKAVSLLLNMIFAEKISELPFYIGVPMDGAFNDIVDAISTGGVIAGPFIIDTRYHCILTVQCNMRTIAIRNNLLVNVNEPFMIELEKDISQPVNRRFYIRALHCDGCGASYDSMRNRICPFCGKSAAVDYRDWVVRAVYRGDHSDKKILKSVSEVFRDMRGIKNPNNGNMQ